MQRVTVDVVSTSPPTVVWSCPACHHDEMETTDKFRLNANGKLADIWLLYRCTRCAAVRKLTVVERAPVHRIPAALFDAATTNDRLTAWRVARDAGLLRRAGARFSRGDTFSVPSIAIAPPATVSVVFPEPLVVRLDHVLAALLGSSRSHVDRLLTRGAVIVSPAGRRLDRLTLWEKAEVSSCADAAVDT